MSDLESELNIAIIDVEKERCLPIMGSFAAETVNVFGWYSAPTPEWDPEAPAPGTVAIVICHFDESERKLADELRAADSVYYGGGGGSDISEAISNGYVIWREITVTNPLRVAEAQAIKDFLAIEKSARIPERLPPCLRPNHPHLVNALATLLQAYRTLDSLLNGEQSERRRLADFAPDRVHAQKQYDRLTDPKFWKHTFKSRDLMKCIRAEWVGSTESLKPVVNFINSWDGAGVERSTSEGAYLELEKQLKLWDLASHSEVK